VINLPFAQVVHNYRASVIRISEIVIIWVANYYRSMKANTPSFVKAHLNVPAQLELAVIGVCVIVSLLVFGYEVVYFFKGLLKNSVLNRSKKVIKDEKNETQKN
jgi:mannose/fructose/N-acetylgalactosamine-specific phosphotransferase system component IIC